MYTQERTFSLLTVGALVLAVAVAFILLVHSVAGATLAG